MPRNTDIFDAVADGCLEDVKYFVEQKGVDVDTQNSSGHAPLHWAIGKNNVEVIKYLVSKGATIQPHLLGVAVAMKEGSLEIVKLFVEKGIDVNHRDSGICPLHVATGNKDIEVAKFLISRGADINSVTSSGLTPLQLAEKHGNTELVKYISELRRGKILKKVVIVIAVLFFLYLIGTL
jgi:ankyrin repeat protein